MTWLTDDLIGTPWVEGGRAETGEGLDCLGLVLEVYRRLDVDLGDLPPFDYRSGWRETCDAYLVKNAPRFFDPVKRITEIGDLGVIPANEQRGQHLGVVVSGEFVVTTSSNAGVHLVRKAAFERKAEWSFRPRAGVRS